MPPLPVVEELENARRFRLAMTHSYRTFVRSEVSTKPGQVQNAGPSRDFVTAVLIGPVLGP